MRINLRFFAIVRERTGESERTIELPPGSVARDALRYVEEQFDSLAPLFRTSMLMRNHEYVGLDEPLADGDEVAFIPPVSGGSLDVPPYTDHLRVRDQPLDIAALTRLAERADAGAVVTFVGTVRDNARGRQVLWLDYESYPEAAEKMLAKIADEMRERWPILAVVVEHRTGKLEISEASVVIAVSSAHRDAAFAAAAYCIERIKQIVPVWKKEAYADGEIWIGSEAAYQAEIGRVPAGP